jgi:hypothetical protein
MSRSPTDTPNLVDQVIARKPLQRAQKAVGELHEVVADCATSRFECNAPERSLFYVFASVFVAMGLAAVTGVMAFSSIIPGAIAYAIYYDGAPGTRLKRAYKSVRGAASKLHEGPQQQLRQFAKTAKELFLYARLAVAQETVANAVDRPAWRVRQLERKGLRLVDRTARKLHLTDLERGKLRAAFRAGQLPRPNAYVQKLTEHTLRANAALG